MPTDVPTNAVRPACFGVCCPLHGRCARYAAVDSAPEGMDIIGTCVRDAEWPLFIQRCADEVVPA